MKITYKIIITQIKHCHYVKADILYMRTTISISMVKTLILLLEFKKCFNNVTDKHLLLTLVVWGPSLNVYLYWLWTHNIVKS